MTNYYLFVYGTLMQHHQHPMHQRLLTGSEFVCYGWITAQLYQIKNYPGAVLSDNETDKVYGELYRLTNASLLAQLDDYEECSAAFPEPHEYQRQQVDVFIDKAKPVKAWAYIYKHAVDPGKQIKTGRFK